MNYTSGVGGDVVCNSQKGLYIMANLTRYAAPYVKLTERDDCGMVSDVNGEWVKFADIKEFLPTTHNKSSAKCQHNYTAYTSIRCVHCGDEKMPYHSKANVDTSHIG
jgi:hypothetical protein